MTPTLYGRWQTRFLLFLTVGVLVTLPFAVGLGSFDPFWVLFWIGFLGFFWDMVYIFLQKWRWDRDWPGIFQLFAGIWEGLFLAFITLSFGGFLPGMQDPLNLGIFIVHYSLVWLSIFIVSQSLMRIFFPRWRFLGGQWL